MRADRIKINHIRSGFFSPVLGPLVRNRRAIILLAAITVVQVALTAAGTIAWQCPVKSTLGVACPACGLTRAMVLVAGSMLPARVQQKFAYQIAAFERHSGIVGLLTLSILAYWILRITNLI
jgi:hypothetical protein